VWGGAAGIIGGGGVRFGGGLWCYGGSGGVGGGLLVSRDGVGGADGGGCLFWACPAASKLSNQT